MPLLKSVYSNGGSYSANEALDVSSLRITDGASDGATVQWGAGDNLLIDASVANDGVVVGSTVSTDFTLTGANAIGSTIFDASADQLQRGSSAFLVPCYSSAVHGLGVTVGAIPLTPSFSGLTTTGADAFTLAAPGTSVPPGYIKEIVLTVDGGDASVGVTGLAAANDIITLSELGQGVKLMAVNATTWVIVSITPGDTTVQSIPAFA